MNEETVYENIPIANGILEEKKSEENWKYVTLSGVTGILMGAGLMYADKGTAKEQATEEVTSNETVDNTLNIGPSNDDLSFGEAFSAARAEIGPGGVFVWHGGIYNTYTAEEWNSMSRAEKNEFAHHINLETRPNDIPTPTDSNPDIIAQKPLGDVHVVEEQSMSDPNDTDDVHIVGYTSVHGHLTVGIDTIGDGQADVAIIDIDDNHQLSDPDLIIDDHGNMATIGELYNESSQHDNMTPNETYDDGIVNSDLPLIDA